MKTTLLLPTLNELEGMKAIMPKISQDWVDQILVVDGNSTDGTAEWARQEGYQVVQQKRKGLRYAYIDAFDAIEGDVVITFSPDGNSIAELIPDLVTKMNEGYDMVIVSRYKDHAKSEDDDAITAFGNRLFTRTINLLHGAAYTDAMVMFRAWRKSVFTDLDMHLDSSYSLAERMFFTKLGCEPLLSVRAAKRKLKCGDIPGDEPPRIGGNRKLQVVRWGSAYMWQVLREKFVWR